MIDLNDLVEMEWAEPEMAPEILPVDARLSIRGSAIELSELFSRSASVAVASTDRETIAGTSNVLVEAVAAQKSTVPFLRATATDGEKTVSVVLDSVTVSREGQVLMPAHRMNAILKLAPTDTVRIEVVGATATIQSGQALWTVSVDAGDALAVSLDTTRVQTSPVDAKSFSQALSATLRAASTSDARHSLMQVQLRNATFTACDGGRVHRMRVPGMDETFSVGIPIGAANEILRAIRASQEESGTFGYDNRHIVFEIGKDRVVAQRLLVDFPEAVESLLMGPAFTNGHSLRVDRRALIETIKRVRVNANPDSAAVSLGVVPKRRNDAGEVEWEVTVRAKDAARNSSQESLECSWNGFKSVDMALNHHYLLDLLEVYPDDTVFFRLGEDTKSMKSPLLVEDEGVGFTGVVQQMYALR